MNKSLCLFVAAGIAAGSVATAQDFNFPVKARKGQMNIMSLNLGVLGSMAKGEMEYDAATAQAAADNLAALTSIDQRFYWPAGSDAMSIDGTRALPALWENIDDVVAKADALNAAVVEAQGTVGTGKEAIGPALGSIGKACTACHDDYREPS